MIQGFLHPLSVPPGSGLPGTELDPINWRPGGAPYNPVLYSERGAINPCQVPDKNLGSEAVAFGVGGMMQHWTAATPRHHPVVERYRFCGLPEGVSDDQLWDKLYARAEALLGTNDQTFANSIRNTLVREALAGHYQRNDKFAPPPEYPVRNLPMAVRRSSDPRNNEFVLYTGTDRILNDVLGKGKLEIRPEHRVKRLFLKNGAVEYAEVEDLLEGVTYNVSAETFVVASGAVMSAYVLWNSGIALDVVGRYIIEHPIAFTQIVLRQELIDSIPGREEWAERLRAKRVRHDHAVQAGGGSDSQSRCSVPVDDVLPIPMDDPPPNVWIPVSENRKWHCQIHKDAFHYGALPPGIDDRLIVDLRWFGVVDPRPDNRVRFEKDRFTAFGTAQPTFEFSYSDEDRHRMHDMMEDMCSAAMSLGGYLPGTEPRFMPKGLALHIQGTTRMGHDPATSVVDEYLKVHQVSNLYVAGNGVIPTANASNPTLTNVALALRSADRILARP